MDAERTLEKVDKWFRAMLFACVIFAIITFLLWAGIRGARNFSVNDYANAVARFWASLTLTVFLGIISVTVKKIHKVLLPLVEKR